MRALRQIHNPFRRIPGFGTSTESIIKGIEKTHLQDKPKPDPENVSAFTEEDPPREKLLQDLADEKALNDRLCAIWERNFNAIPFFEGSTSSDIDVLRKETEAFLWAREAMGEFENLVFPLRICPALEILARDLQRRIVGFPFNIRQKTKRLAGEIAISTDRNHKNILNSGSGEIQQLQEIMQLITDQQPLLTSNASQWEKFLDAVNRLFKLHQKVCCYDKENIKPNHIK